LRLARGGHYLVYDPEAMDNYIDLTRAFYRRVIGNPRSGDTGKPSVFETDSMPEFTEAATHLGGTVAKALKDVGVNTDMRGGKKPGSQWATLRTESGDTFTVRYRQGVKRPQAVTQTSREAYHSIDFSTCQGRVLDLIYAVSLKGLDVTRAEIADVLDMDKSGVSGRVNELFEMAKAQPFRIDGKYYRLSNTSPRLSNLPGATVKNEAFRLVECPAYNNSPAAPAAQTKLFT